MEQINTILREYALEYVNKKEGTLMQYMEEAIRECIDKEVLGQKKIVAKNLADVLDVMVVEFQNRIQEEKRSRGIV